MTSFPRFNCAVLLICLHAHLLKRTDSEYPSHHKTASLYSACFNKKYMISFWHKCINALTALKYSEIKKKLYVATDQLQLLILPVIPSISVTDHILNLFSFIVLTINSRILEQGCSIFHVVTTKESCNHGF
jgi:hypothetical protein